MGLVTDYLTSSERALTDEEIKDVTRVYKDNIDYSRVSIADDLGAGSREWTEPAGGPLDLYVIHLGRHGFKTTTDKKNRATLVHELCHVWQGMHHIFAWGYVAGSGLAQLISGDDAYNYKALAEAGVPWSWFNVEQQAQLVEDWYKDGLKTTSPLYDYITGYIWHPRLSWLKEVL